MLDTELFIPPCCVDKKLPQALIQAPYRSLTFYTHSDVTLDKFYRAVSHMVGERHVMVVSMDYVAVDSLVFFYQCFERGWITDLVLTTSKDCSSLLELHLADFRDHVLYACHKDATDLSAHLVLYNADKALVLEGPIYSRVVCSGLTAYHATLYPMFSTASNGLEWGNPLRNALFPDVLRLRQQIKRTDRAKLNAVLSHFLKAEFPPYD